jgi:hypothetical protein
VSGVTPTTVESRQKFEVTSAAAEVSDDPTVVVEVELVTC